MSDPTAVDDGDQLTSASGRDVSKNPFCSCDPDPSSSWAGTLFFLFFNIPYTTAPIATTTASIPMPTPIPIFAPELSPGDATGPPNDVALAEAEVCVAAVGVDPVVKVAAALLGLELKLDVVATAAIMYPFICPPGMVRPFAPMVVLFGVHIFDERP